MSHVIATHQVAPEATPRAGNPPPGYAVRASGGSLTVLDGAAAGLSGPVSYETEVTMTGETSFVEKGTLVVGDRTLSIDTIGEGVLEPSADAGVLQGGVLWRVADRATGSELCGIVASSFMVDPSTGRSSENQVLRLFGAR